MDLQSSNKYSVKIRHSFDLFDDEVLFFGGYILKASAEGKVTQVPDVLS